MATTLASLPLHTDAWRIYSTSAPEDQQKISETVSNVIVNFSSMGSNSMSNSALYEHDFFEWTQVTATLLRLDATRQALPEAEARHERRL